MIEAFRGNPEEARTRARRWIFAGIFIGGVLAYCSIAAVRSYLQVPISNPDRPYALVASLLFAAPAAAALSRTWHTYWLTKQLAKSAIVIQPHTLVLDGIKFSLKTAELTPLQDKFLNQIWPMSEYFWVSGGSERELCAPSIIGIEFVESLCIALEHCQRAVPEFVSPSVRSKFRTI